MLSEVGMQCRTRNYGRGITRASLYLVSDHSITFFSSCLENKRLLLELFMCHVLQHLA